MSGDSVQSAGTSAATASGTWQPVIKELKAFSEKDSNDKSLLGIFLMGIVGGFHSLANTLRMAHYSNDSKLLPKTCQRRQEERYP